MLTRLRAHALPYGGAVHLQLLTDEHETVLVQATRTPTPPAGPDDPNARTVYGGALRWRCDPAQVWTTPRAGQHWYQVLDLDTARLPDGQPVTYHVTDSGGAVQSATVTPACAMTTTAVLIRDVIRPRLEYHLKRAVRAGRFGDAVKDIKVYEQEVLASNTPTPAVLIKERAVPDASDTVGKGGDVVLSSAGEPVREFTRNARGTLDCFVLTDNPQHRAEVGRFVYEVLHQDLPYFEASGLQGTTVSRHDTHSVDGNSVNIYGSEVSVECLVQVTTQQGAVGLVTDNNATVVFRP